MVTGLIKNTNIYSNSSNTLETIHKRYLDNINNMSKYELMFILIAQAIKLYLFAYVFYRYIKHLEKNECDCAINYPYFKYIKWFFFAISLVILYNMLINVIRLFNFNVYTPLFIYIIQISASFIGIFGLIWVLYFLNAIEDCECSKNKDRDMMYLYSVMILGVVAFLTLLPLLTILISSGLKIIYTIL